MSLKTMLHIENYFLYKCRRKLHKTLPIIFRKICAYLRHLDEECVSMEGIQGNPSSYVIDLSKFIYTLLKKLYVHLW